jgi:hypothetical protein
MCVDDESIDDDPKLWWACQAIIYTRCASAKGVLVPPNVA